MLRIFINSHANLCVKNSYFRILLTTVIIFICLPGLIVTNASDKLVSDEPHDVEVLLLRNYLDGEISEEVIEETIWSMEDFWSYYDEWELVDQNNKQIIFQKEIDDISPLLKMHGYFGLSEDGTLTIFNGKPEEQEIIQSFFQINTRQLKSQSHNLLRQGIRISTKDEYIQVLKNYRKYAING